MSAICDAHKKKVDVEQSYNAVHRKFNQFGDQISWREDAGLRNMPQRGCPPPGLRFSSPRDRERNAVMANRVGLNMLQFCSDSNSLSHTTLSIKCEVYFSERLCRSSLLCRCVLHADVYVLCGYTTI